MRLLINQCYFMVIFILSLQNFANCELTSEDVQEGACVNIPTNISSTNIAFVFSNLEQWYVPLANSYALRMDAEAMLYNRSLYDQNEFDTLKTKFSIPYLSLSDLLFSSLTLSPFAMGTITGFGGTKTIKVNGIITGYFTLRADCINQIVPNSNLYYNAPDINCEKLNPHVVTVVETNVDDGWFLINICYTVNNQRGFMVLSQDPVLPQDAIDRVKSIVSTSGYYSEDKFAYQTY